MSTIKSTLTAALLSVSMVAPALAQVATSANTVTGDVVVQRAGEFYASTSVGDLLDGDCVAKLDETPATITLENGCALDLNANQSVFIDATATSCDEAFTPAEGVCNVADFENQDLMLGLLPLLIGAAVITATVVAVADDDDPASP